MAEISAVLQAMTTEKYQVISDGLLRATIIATMRRIDVLHMLVTVQGLLACFATRLSRVDLHNSTISKH